MYDKMCVPGVKEILNVLFIVGAQPGKPGGKAPTFKEKPSVKQEGGGKNLVIECKCSANPKPDITWYKDNKVLKETNRVKSRMSGTGEDFVLNLDILVRDIVSLSVQMYRKSYCTTHCVRDVGAGVS